MEELSRDLHYCPKCGKSLQVNVRPYQLKPGTILNGRYLIGTIIGRGGFGITYIGRDLNLDIKVAIKEYFPEGYAQRHNEVTSALMITDDSGKEFYERQKSNFLQEARSIAKFTSEKGIVDVRDYFEDNNTAYIIMEYLDGISLSQYVKNNGPVPSRKMFALMLPVMDSLKVINAENIIHRDITPENMMMLRDGSIKLMDFGSARYLNNAGREMTVMLKQGYAPEEQYRSDIRDQGPWTDVYGLCASIYKCITGVTPQGALDRLANDRLKKPSECGIAIDPDLEMILMYGLEIRKENRCKSMGELRSLTERVLSGLPLETVHMPAEEIYSNSGRTDAGDNLKTYGDDDMYNNYNDSDYDDGYSTQKKSNKGLIALVIIIVTLVLIVAGIIVFATISSNSKNNKNATANTAATTVTATQQTQKETEKQTKPEPTFTEAPTVAPPTDPPTDVPTLEPYTDPPTQQTDVTLEPDTGEYIEYY